MAARAVSPPFSPPEQYGGAGRTDTYSDVYALGATLYVLLAGELLPDSVMRQAGVSLPSLRQANPSVSPHVEQVVTRALQLRTSDRYANAAEFLRALKAPAPAAAAAGSPMAGPKPGGAQSTAPGHPCPRCGATPITANAPFCHACGGPILLRFPSINQQIGDPTDLISTCDRAWLDALKLIQSGTLERWLETYQQSALLAQFHAAQSRYAGNLDAVLEAFLRPSPPQGLDTDHSTLDFGACAPDAAPRQTLALRRRHPGYIHGSVHSQAPWIAISTSAIAVRPYEPGMILTIGVDLAKLATSEARQDYSSAVTIDTNHGSLRLPVQITINNPPRPRLQPPAIHVGKVQSLRRTGGSVAIINEGGGVIAGTVRAEPSWLTVEAQHARFSLGYCQHATVNFGVTTEQLTPAGAHRGALVWETNIGTLVTDVHIEVTPPYAVDSGDPTTAIKQKGDLVKLCDREPRRNIDNWERGRAWLHSGRIAAALRFLGEDALAQVVDEWMRFSDANVGLERVLRAVGAKPAYDYKDNSGELVRRIMGVFSHKPPVVEYVILNTSQRGYLHGYIQPLADWLNIPAPRFGCLPGEEATVPIYPDYKRRTYGDLFEPVVE
jgi:hypothetical protein